MIPDHFLRSTTSTHLPTTGALCQRHLPFELSGSSCLFPSVITVTTVTFPISWCYFLLKKKKKSRLKKKYKHSIHFLGLKIPTPHAIPSHTCPHPKRGQIPFLLKLVLKNGSSKRLSEFMTPGWKLQKFSEHFYFLFFKEIGKSKMLRAVLPFFTGYYWKSPLELICKCVLLHN